MPNKIHKNPSKEVSAAYQKSVLPNGIRVVSEEIPHVKSVSIGIWIDTGSQNETELTNGVSHFVEHMVFKGTEHRSTQQIARSLESVGGYLNAFTTKEHTCYYARVLDEFTELAVDVLSDLVQFPLFPEKEIEKEKKVVLEEIKNAEDDPDDLIHDYFETDIYFGHSLRFPVLGSARNIKSFARRDLLQYVKNRYASDNIVVAAAGNISHAKFVSFVEKYFTLNRKAPKVSKQSKIPSVKKKLREYEKPIQQAHICTGTVGYSVYSKSRFPSLVLNTLLGDGMSSRLFQNIRERYGFAYSVYSFLNMMRDTGSFGVYIGTDKTHIEKSLDLIFGELRGLTKKGISKAELERTKAQLKGNMLLGLESTSARMMRLGTGELYFGEFTELGEISKEIDAVTIDDVSHVARQLFKEDSFSTIIFTPSGN
ncbi:MAG TPA: pitrilysin family protein [Bacteroidota bacterium]|nr:pitrilysin family protein [Bacteroidota bacterium]